MAEVDARLFARLDILETLLRHVADEHERIGRLEAHAAHNAEQMDRLMVLVERLAQGG